MQDVMTVSTKEIYERDEMRETTYETLAYRMGKS